MPTVERGSRTTAIPYTLPPSQVSPEDNDPANVSPSVYDAFDADLESEGKWDSSGIPPFREIDVRSNLPKAFTVIRDKRIEYSGKTLSTSANALKLALPWLNTPGEQRVLFEGVVVLPSTVCSYGVHIELFLPQMSS